MLLADTLTDTNGTAIGSHTPEKGGAWTKHTNSTPSPTVQGNGLVSSTSGAAWAHSAATPGAVDQEINGIVVMGVNATNEPGICARMDTAATTFYDVRYEAAAGQFALYKTVAGTETQLGFPFAFANVAGSSAYVTFSCTDAVKQVFVNGDLAIESTDNAITAVGKLGVRVKGSDTAGAVLDRVWASSSYTAAVDSFNNGVNTNDLADRAGALRSRWTQHPVATATHTLLFIPSGGAPLGALPGGAAYSAGQFTSYYYVVAQPASADYDVSALLEENAVTPVATPTVAGVAGRMTLTGNPPNYYAVRYNASAAQFELLKVVSGVGTQLVTPYAEANVQGRLRHVTLELLGTTINMWVDGVLRGAATDSAITAAGRAGITVTGGAAGGSSTGSHNRVRPVLFQLGATLTDIAPPNTPTLSTCTPKVAAVTCAWTTVADVGSSGLRGYRVEYRLTGGSGLWSMSTVVFTGTSGTVWGLPTGTSYDFRIRAEDNAGNLSLASNAIAATPIVATPQPPAYNALTGTHSGSVTVHQASLTADQSQVSVHYGGGKTTFPDDPAFDVGAVCTLRAIVKPDTIPSAGTHRTLIERVNAYSLKMNGSSLEGTVIIGATPVTVTAAAVFVASTTVDVAVTYDGVNLQLWDGGVQVDAAIPATGVVDAVSTDIVVGDGFIGFIQQPEVLAEALAADRLAEDALALALTERSEILAGPFGTTDSLGNSTMTDLAIKQHDTWPPLTYRLTDVGRDIEAISKTGSTVTVVTETIHRMTTGDYVYIDSTNSYSDDIARSIVVTGPKSFTYTDTDASAKTAEGFGTTARGVDLSTVTAVRLLMRSNTVLVAGTTTIDSPQTSRRGRGSYSWVAPDTAFIGTYNLEFEANFGSGKIETFPNSGYLTVQIVDDLDEVG